MSMPPEHSRRSQRRYAVLLTAATAALAAAASLAVHAEQSVYPNVAPTGPTRAVMIQPAPPGEIEILPLRDNIFVLFGAGANITVSVGADGALLVDAGAAMMADKVLAAVRRLQVDWALHNEPRTLAGGAEGRSSIADRHVVAPPKPIRYILDTSADADHVGANEKLRNSGRTYTGGNVAGDIRDSGEGAAIFAHENVLSRMSATGEGQPPASADSFPTDTYYVAYYKLSQFVNGEGVQLIHVPKAHSDGDSMVYLRRNDVLALGDLMSSGTYPLIDTSRGGTVNGLIEGLNMALDLAITEFRTEGGTMMVPGHGRLVDTGDVAYYRDMMTIIRDRVQDMVKKGMTLEQVKAARPTADYDPEYGASSGFSTTDRFVEAVYTSLGGGKPAAAPARRAPARPAK
jgi:glyoxylase-like metal-dependent hydrolase (beta-lactamase superfamily II)